MTIKQPYPLDPSDVLDFEWEWVFADSDAVASYSFKLDAGLLLVASSLSGNRVTAWVQVDPAVTVPNLTVLGITCHMVSSTSPPRELDRTIALLIKQQ